MKLMMIGKHNKRYGDEANNISIEGDLNNLRRENVRKHP